MQTLEIRCEDLEPNISKVNLSGRLDIAGVQDIELKFTVYTSARRKPVIVDLSEVTLITSMGLGMLITNAKTLQAQGIPFVLLNPQPLVEKVVTMSGLNELLPIEKDLTSALNRIQKG
jgi:anti-anti-sigma factor